MYPVPAPPNTRPDGEPPLRAGEEEEEHHEKNTVLKKVKDKVKKIKNVISKKSHGHGNEGEDNDHHQHRELDEGDNGFQEDDEIEEDPAVHGVPTNERSAAGAGIVPQEMSGGGGGEGTKGAGDVSGFITEEFHSNEGIPRTDPERETRIQQNQEFENPSTGGRTGAKEISADPERETRIQQNQEFENPSIGGRTGAKEISTGGGRGTEGVGDGLCLTTEKFVGDLPLPRIETERNTESEQNRASESSTTNVRTADNEMSRGWSEGAKGVDDNLGVIKEESVENPAASNTEEAYVSPVTAASTGANERSTRDLEGGDSSQGVNDGVGLITEDLIKDPETPKADDEAKARSAWSQVQLSPTTGARTGVNEMFEREVDDGKGSGDGLGLTTMELVEDPAAPKTEAEANTKTEQTRGGEEAEISPELCRSLEAMTVTTQNDGGETELPKSANNSYTDMVSSAASKVYDIVADAGTAVISKVKPVGTKDGEGEAVGNQGKGVSFKEYITEKLTPGEDEKALSELIREAGQKRNNEAVEVPRQEGTGSEEGGRGVGVVGKIRETITSFLGGGQGSPKSPQRESHTKVAEDNNDLHGRPPEAIYQEKGSDEELPSSYH